MKLNVIKQLWISNSFNGKFLNLFILICLFIKTTSYVHMCWYVNWSEIRPKLPFNPDFIDYSLCSHIIYSAGIIDPYTYDILFMQKNIKTNMYKILTSKKKYKHIKVILTIGSYDTKSFGFNAVTNPNDTDAMSLFSLKLIKFLRKHDFDGVLMDYEFPNMKVRGSAEYTKHGFSLLLKKVKEEFQDESTATNRSSLLLLAAVAARVDWIDNFYETDQVTKYLDYLLLLSYDLRNSKNKKAYISSALFPSLNQTGIDSLLNQASAVAKWLTVGAKPEKIVIGIAAYGRTFELVDPYKYNSTEAPIVGPAPPGEVTEESGVLSYFEICDKIAAPGSVKSWQSQNLSPYLLYENKYWASYEDLDSVYEKMVFIKANLLAGAFLWSIDLDDFQGDNCNQGKFPLLNAIKTELETIDNEKRVGMSNKKNQIPLISKSLNLDSSKNLMLTINLLFILMGSDQIFL